MSIKSPATYGDYYWAMQVEANKLYADDTEKSLTGYARQIINDFGFIEELPPSIRNLFSALQEPPSFGLAEILGRFTSEVADSTLTSGISPVLRALGYKANSFFRGLEIPFPQAALLYQRKKIPDDFFKARYEDAGYTEDEAAAVYDASKPYPSISDLVLYSRYHGEPDNVWSTIIEFMDIDPVDYKLWDWLGLQRLTTMQVQTLFRRGLITEPDLFEHLAKIGWSKTDRPFIEELGWSTPNAMLLVQGDLQQGLTRDRILSDITIADINPKFAQQYLDAILTKPASSDLVAYHLRKDPSLSDLPADLRKIGIHDSFIDVYRTLAYPIPPVADIITMAVREAFTPEIAQRFGQYEDYPPEFEDWAQKKGLSSEWSKRYWAAHWSLPSASQGFDMLHRGLISREELDMLLRALDVMPFWREKLTGIAYRLLSRVDIRRMYGVGVLTEDEVYDAYLELGYSERDARRMSDFTIKQILATQSKFTATDIISAYTKYMITRSEASDLLQDVGVKPENISFILSSAEYKREWSLTEARITAIRNLYKKEVYDDNKARAELLKLDLPAERVDVLMEQWYIDEKDKPPRYWTTAQTLSFIKEGLITKQRGITELSNIGYDTEHINVYMAGVE